MSSPSFVPPLGSTPPRIVVSPHSVIVDTTTPEDPPQQAVSAPHRRSDLLPVSRVDLLERETTKRLAVPLPRGREIPAPLLLRDGHDGRLVTMVDRTFDERACLLRLRPQQPLALDAVPVARYFPYKQERGHACLLSCTQQLEEFGLTTSTKAVDLERVTYWLRDSTEALVEKIPPDGKKLSRLDPLWALRQVGAIDGGASFFHFNDETLGSLVRAATTLNIEVVVSPQDCTLALVPMRSCIPFPSIDKA